MKENKCVPKTLYFCTASGSDSKENCRHSSGGYACSCNHYENSYCKNREAIKDQ